MKHRIKGVRQNLGKDGGKWASLRQQAPRKMKEGQRKVQGYQQGREAGGSEHRAGRRLGAHRQRGSFTGTAHCPVWPKGMASSCHRAHRHGETVIWEFSVDFWNHRWFHTKWTDYCFRAELESQKITCSSLTGMNNFFHSTNQCHQNST